LGHTAVAAYSAAEALELIPRHAPVDLIITDQAMPNMTGLQLARAVQQRWPEIPIILATGYAEMEPGTQFDFPKLSKPFTEAQLKQEIERVVLRDAPRELSP
jgi:CheY-like chemotaxis protein